MDVQSNPIYSLGPLRVRNQLLRHLPILNIKVTLLQLRQVGAERRKKIAKFFARNSLAVCASGLQFYLMVDHETSPCKIYKYMYLDPGGGTPTCQLISFACQ